MSDPTLNFHSGTNLSQTIEMWHAFQNHAGRKFLLLGPSMSAREGNHIVSYHVWNVCGIKNTPLSRKTQTLHMHYVSRRFMRASNILGMHHANWQLQSHPKLTLYESELASLKAQHFHRERIHHVASWCSRCPHFDHMAWLMVCPHFVHNPDLGHSLA